jgi:tetratricopeptide (TPR) repeat protein
MDPTLTEARFNRAVALLKLNRLADASTELQRIVAGDDSPLRVTAAYHNALALDRMGRPDDAEKWLSRAMDIDPAFDPAVLYTGVLRERRGDLQGAARSYLDYLRRNPDSTVAMLRLGMSAHRAGRLDVAKTYLKKVIDLAPASPEATEARKFLVMWE